MPTKTHRTVLTFEVAEPEETEPATAEPEETDRDAEALARARAAHPAGKGLAQTEATR